MVKRGCHFERQYKTLKLWCK